MFVENDLSAVDLVAALPVAAQAAAVEAIIDAIFDRGLDTGDSLPTRAEIEFIEAVAASAATNDYVPSLISLGGRSFCYAVSAFDDSGLAVDYYAEAGATYPANVVADRLVFWLFAPVAGYLGR